jgi:hypothetical protein
MPAGDRFPTDVAGLPEARTPGVAEVADGGSSSRWTLNERRSGRTGRRL